MNTIFKRLTILLLCFPLLYSADEFGTVLSLKGKVSVNRKFKEIKIKSKETLFEKDRIITKKDSSLDIEMDEENNIHIAENSKITLRKDKSKKKETIFLELLSGSVRCKLDKLKNRSFIIKTPVAVAGVRGTDFITTFQPELGAKAFGVTVLSGEVSVSGLDQITSSLSESTSVKPNQKILVSADGKMAAVVPVPATEMKALREKFPVNIKIKDVKKSQSKEKEKKKKNDDKDKANEKNKKDSKTPKKLETKILKKQPTRGKRDFEPGKENEEEKIEEKTEVEIDISETAGLILEQTNETVNQILEDELNDLIDETNVDIERRSLKLDFSFDF